MQFTFGIDFCVYVLGIKCIEWIVLQEVESKLKFVIENSYKFQVRCELKLSGADKAVPFLWMYWKEVCLIIILSLKKNLLVIGCFNF